MFAKTAFPSTQMLTQTNAFCSKGKEESLKSSPNTSAARHGAPHSGPHLGRGDWRGRSATELAPNRDGPETGSVRGERVS